MNRRDFLRGAAVALVGAAAAAVVGMQPATPRPVAAKMYDLNLPDPPFLLKADGCLYECHARARNLMTPAGVMVEIWYEWELVLDGIT